MGKYFDKIIINDGVFSNIIIYDNHINNIGLT